MTIKENFEDLEIENKERKYQNEESNSLLTDLINQNNELFENKYIKVVKENENKILNEDIKINQNLKKEEIDSKLFQKYKLNFIF